MTKTELKALLDDLYHEYNERSCCKDDPLFYVRTFNSRQDIEIAALIASALAYGTIASIKKSAAEVLGSLKPSPYAYVRSFHHGNWERTFGNFRHRFNDGEDMANLIFFIKQMIERSGSIENFFMEGYDPSDGIKEGLLSFSKRALLLKRVQREKNARGRGKVGGVEFFFSSPIDGSCCKRMNLFLRWMVRKDNVDIGLWKGIHTSKLIIPVDTHIAHAAQRFGLTVRKNPSWNMAAEITEALRKFDWVDPVKYDFALCHCSWLRS